MHNTSTDNPYPSPTLAEAQHIALWGGTLANAADRNEAHTASPAADAQPSAPLPQGFRR